MSLNEIAAAAVKLAQSITFITGSWKASAILGLVQTFLKGIDLSAITDLLTKIFGA